MGFYDAYFKDTFDEYAANFEELDVAPENIIRFSDGGVITAWTHIEDWRSFRKIDLVLQDTEGKSVRIPGIENSVLPREENRIKSDDLFPDYEFNCDQPLKKWEDFMLVNGRNFLFWELATSVDIDLSQIVSWKAYDGEREVSLIDPVMHAGLCKDKNSLGGKWFSPNGLPQYGVWWPRAGSLVMKNVEQEQYPSNGDHVRILSSVDTPENFLLRTRFTVTGLEKIPWHRKVFRWIEGYGQGLKNTYVRLAWDFDDEYDPGHDQTLVYNTLEYGYLGVQRVFPIERYFVQGYEPDQTDVDAKAVFSFENNKTYEMEVKVEGQKVNVEVYKLGFFYDRRMVALEYEFLRPRSGTSYPFSVETTGNVEILLDEIEIRKKE